MVQIGDFNFARKSDSIARDKDPVLLAWPLNNYWDTNFRASQPGYVEINYLFQAHGKFDPISNPIENKSKTVPLEIHPVINCQEEKTEHFFMLSNKEFHVLHTKKSEDNLGIIFRLINRGQHKAEGTLTIPGKSIEDAYICTILEEEQSPVQISDNAATITLIPNQITTVKLIVR